MALPREKKKVLFRRWSSDEIRVLKKYFSKLPTRDVAALLPRTAAAIEEKAHTLGRYKLSQQWWTAQEIKRLRKYYPNMASRKLAEKMHRTTRSVEIKASKLGLRKTKKYLKKIASKMPRG